MPVHKMPENKIHYLELGHGDGKHITQRARNNPDEMHMGIEWKRVERGKPLARMHNLKLVSGDVLTRLTRIASASVETVAANFFFSGYVTDRPDLSNGKWRVPVSTIIKQVKRVLVKGGRFEIIDWGGNLRLLQLLFEDIGFECKEASLPKDEKEKSTWLKDIESDLRDPVKQRSLQLPTKMVAIKK